MRKLKKDGESKRDIFVGRHHHKRTCNVTVRTIEVELFSRRIPGHWDALRDSKKPNCYLKYGQSAFRRSS